MWSSLRVNSTVVPVGVILYGQDQMAIAEESGRGLTRRDAMGSMIWATALGASLRTAGAAGKQPNFLFFLTDDQRRDAMSAYGNKILYTPNMDRIASEGIRFNLGFATNALCRPSRTFILTGQYSHTHGVMHNLGRVDAEHLCDLGGRLVRLDGLDGDFGLQAKGAACQDYGPLDDIL
jgi:hypothetical protein